MNFFYGVVENRDDPLKLGRCQVRIVGLHTQEKSQLPTSDLPWATPMQPVTSAAMNGIGWTPVGPVEGTSVIILFADAEQQQPIMIGTVGGIPQSKSAEIATEESGNIITDGGVVSSPDGKPLTKADGSEITLGNLTESSTNNVVTAANSAITSIKNKASAMLSSALGVDLSNILPGQSVPQPKKETLVLPIKGADDEKAPTVVPKVVPKEEAKITSQPEPAKADPKILNTPINLQPMQKYVRKGTDNTAKQSIAALVAACDKVGLTSKYAKASILGICGVESGWCPVPEDHDYSKVDSLVSAFSAFNGDKALASEYTKGKKTKPEFFEMVYGYKCKVGQGLGNKAPGEGGKYYGRGFNQLTGKSGYIQTQKELEKYGIKVDLVNNPDLLLNDIEVAALACAIYYKLNVKHDPNDPGYFVAARARTGKDVHDGYKNKQAIYEYYLGQSVLTESTNKPSAEDPKGKIYTPEEVAYLPPEKQKALLEDRSENATLGFKDPNGKYPLRNLLNEPDTNRLARGIIQDTAIAFKDQIRTTNIPTTNGNTWEQPLAPFGGKYPFTKVYETESGHVQLFDDTTGHETLSLYHRKGTFLDIDANGTQVNKIVGDGYTIYDRNGFIYVAGKCNLTVGNSVNIMVVGDANIEVNGQVSAVFHNNADIGVANDLTVAVGGDFNLQVGGNMNTTVNGNKVDHTTGTSQTHVVGEMSLVADANMLTQSAGTISTKAGADIMFDSGASFSAKAQNEAKLNGTGDVHILSSGTVYMDGTAFRGQQGSAQGADNIESITGASPLSLSAPGTAVSKGDSYEVLQTPVRPAPPAEIKMELLDEYHKEATAVDYGSIPPAATENGIGAASVKAEPKTNNDPPAMPSQNTSTGDLYGFITKHYNLGLEGYWTEKAMATGKIEDSNPNIIAMWKDIGLANILTPVTRNSKGEITSGGDQTAWCMAFVTWCLKQNGYKWCQTPMARAITDNPAKFGCVKVDTPRNGDIVHVQFAPGKNHVAFVSDCDGTKFKILGGNQGGSGGGNNPSGGLVNKSKGFVTMQGASWCTVIGVYRPSKEQ